MKDQISVVLIDIIEKRSFSNACFVLILFITSLVTRTISHGFGPQAQRLHKFAGLIQPEQIHLSFGKTSQDIVIMWATKKNVKFEVEFAETVEKIRILDADMAVLEEPKKSKAVKYIHRVYLSDLKPGETYTYRIIGKSGASSDVFTFKVPYNSPGKVHIFMIFADMGLRSKSLQFASHEAASGMYETVFHLGDIAYNLHSAEGATGDTFLKLMEKFAAKVPYLTVPGDHENYVDFLHYRYRFSMPRIPWPMPSDKLWYCIDIGPIHFIALNTEVFFTQINKDKQLKWLRDDLQKVNTQRDQHPWIIILGHRPMYCSPTATSNQGGLDCEEEDGHLIRSELEDVFFEEGVDMYISGHMHNYERSWPLYRGNTFQKSYRNPKAPIYIVNGAMGYEYLVETITSKSSWSAFSLSDSRKELYGKLEVLNSTHLMWDVYAAGNNEHIDSILIIQEKHGSFGKAGDDAYEKMLKFQQLPPAPAHWKQAVRNSNSEMFNLFYELPQTSRTLFLLSLCCTMFCAVTCLLCIPGFRRKVCRRHAQRF